MEGRWPDLKEWQGTRGQAWGCHGHRHWVLALPLPLPPGSSAVLGSAGCTAGLCVHAGFSAVHGRLVCSRVHGRLVCSVELSGMHGRLVCMLGSVGCMVGSCAGQCMAGSSAVLGSVQCMAGSSAVRAQWWTLCSRRLLRSPNVSPGSILSLEGMVWSLPLSLLPL